MSVDVKRDIVAKRRERIALEGHSFGHAVPEQRYVPLVPFDRAPFVICEVKRRSPSKGVIAGDLNAVDQARRYVEAGIKTISVLTEEDSFGGSLDDLMAVKSAFPETAVLRKDFLIDRADVDVSYRAGADAILLIASILEPSLLADLKTYAEGLGLSVFVEVHDADDCARVRALVPAFTGINCRNLTDFSTDRAIPLKTKTFVDWKTRLVFESGIFRPEEAEWVASSGFQGLLVGEGVVRHPALAAQLAQRFRPQSVHHPDPQPSFWPRLFAQAARSAGRPLVKICGLAHYDDLALADELGADLVGMILAPSKRQVDVDFVRRSPKTRALKVGVVQLGPDEPVPEEVTALVDDGILAALQFHGDESPALLDEWSSRGYKAVRLAGAASWMPWTNAAPPRILADAGSGGSGQPVADDELSALSSSPFGGHQLWLAGGLTAESIASKIERWRPELVDASSGLESEPGRKDPAKLRHFFKEIHRVSR